MKMQKETRGSASNLVGEIVIELQEEVDLLHLAQNLAEIQQ